MFRRSLSLMLLFAMMCSGLSRFLVLAGFKVNREYIVQNLCENRTRPLIHCDGKCYLAKQLKKAIEREKKESERHETKEVIYLIVDALKLTYELPVIIEPVGKPLPFYKTGYLNKYIQSIFRPPKMSV